MIKFLNEALKAFEECFSRKAPFKWFVVVILGMMTRHDKLGVTSVIRALGLEPRYEALNKFFRSDSWKLNILERKWLSIVARFAPLEKYNGAPVIVGDGIKNSKEARRMPGVKRLHQSSEDSSKAASIFGQMFGSIGVLAGAFGKTFCIPLACELQDGVKNIFAWGEKNWERQGSHTVELIHLAHRMTAVFENALILLDRYYLTVPALRHLNDLNAGGGNLRAIIMAKMNSVAYEMPAPRKTGAKGRPAKKGKTIKLAGLFQTEASRFAKCDVELYGKKSTVQYLSKDLLWGKELYRIVRFVLAVLDGKQVIIASTDISIPPIDIILLYSKRFTIESMFKAMKQDIAAFTNRFWSKYLPKLNRFSKKEDKDRLADIKSKHERELIRKALDASEGYVFCGVVATGLLQMISLMHMKSDAMKKLRYMRTPSKSAASEATVAEYLQRNILWLLKKEEDLPISRIIFEKIPRDVNDFYDERAVIAS
jgi:hypothetical protein